MYGIARLLQTSRRAIPYKNHGLRRASVRLHCNDPASADDIGQRYKANDCQHENGNNSDGGF